MDLTLGKGRAMELTASTFALVKDLGDFTYELSVLDHVWNILFPDEGGKWHHVNVNKYKHTFYVTHVNGGSSLEVEPRKGIRVMDATGVSSYLTLDQIISGKMTKNGLGQRGKKDGAPSRSLARA